MKMMRLMMGMVALASSCAFPQDASQSERSDVRFSPAVKLMVRRMPTLLDSISGPALHTGGVGGTWALSTAPMAQVEIGRLAVRGGVNIHYPLRKGKAASFGGNVLQTESAVTLTPIVEADVAILSWLGILGGYTEYKERLELVGAGPGQRIGTLKTREPYGGVRFGGRKGFNVWLAGGPMYPDFTSEISFATANKRTGLFAAQAGIGYGW